MKRALAFLFFVACQPPTRGDHDAAAAPAAASACSAIGQSCMFSPGKLGTCIEVEPTSGPATLVCQSQH